jgi:hypothetical protein
VTSSVNYYHLRMQVFFFFLNNNNNNFLFENLSSDDTINAAKNRNGRSRTI